MMDGVSVNETTTILTHLDEDDSGNKSSHVTVMFKYWLDGPVGLSVASIGILLNMVAIVVLARQRVQRTFHLLMISLSCWDFCYLVLSIICFAMPMMSAVFRDTVFIHMVPYAIPLAQICLSGSCYSTVALTVERYIAVCAPFFRLRHNIKTRFYILPILIFAPLYNMPRFFEFRTVTNTTFECVDHLVGQHVQNISDYDQEQHFDLMQDYSENMSSLYFREKGAQSALILTESEFLNMTVNQTLCDHWNKRTVIDLVVTDFRHNHTYVTVYVNYVNLIVNLLLPTIMLAVLNCLIYRALQSSMKSHSSDEGNTLRRTRGSEEALRKRDIRLTRIAIFIVCIFITCHLPRFIPNVVEMFTPQLPEWFAILISFNNLLQIINCTVNYIIYFGHCWKLKKSEKQSQSGQEFEMCVTTNGTGLATRHTLKPATTSTFATTSVAS